MDSFNLASEIQYFNSGLLSPYYIIKETSY